MSNTPDLESRSVPGPVELRSAGSRRIGGIAAPYNKPSRPLGATAPFLEVFEQRAFSKSIGDGFVGVVANLEHNAAALLGTVDSGTLEIADTRDGLDYTIDLPNTTAGNDALEYVSRGLIKGTSVSMMVYADHFEMRGAGLPTRYLEGVRLMAISPVSVPAYAEATVSMRSFAAQFDAELDAVVADAENGRLSRYFDNRHPVVIDTSPTPLAVAQRSHSGGDIDLQRRRLESNARKIQMDTGRRPDEPRPMSIEQRLLELRRRKMLWDTPVEARSLPVGDRDRFGNTARRNSNGHAID
jgi:HK97 family phage prohead protease